MSPFEAIPLNELPPAFYLISAKLSLTFGTSGYKKKELQRFNSPQVSIPMAEKTPVKKTPVKKNPVKKNPDQDIPSPCISICEMDEEQGVCKGCYRTRDEIRAWRDMDGDSKKQLIILLHERRQKIGPVARPRRVNRRRGNSG